jgi:hypothetical protein
MIEFRYVAGLGIYFLLMWLFPLPMMFLFWLATAGWLLLMMYALLTDSPSGSSKGNWESKDVDARDYDLQSK